MWASRTTDASVRNPIYALMTDAGLLARLCLFIEQGMWHGGQLISRIGAGILNTEGGRCFMLNGRSQGLLQVCQVGYWHWIGDVVGSSDPLAFRLGRMFEHVLWHC